MCYAVKVWRKVRRGQLRFPQKVEGLIATMAKTELLFVASASLVFVGFPGLLLGGLLSGSAHQHDRMLGVVAATLILDLFVFVFALLSWDAQSENWYALLRACQLVYPNDATLEYLGEQDPRRQVYRMQEQILGLARLVVMAEREHPDQEYHPDRVSAKAKFEQAYKDCVVARFIENNGYGEYFRPV